MISSYLSYYSLCRMLVRIQFKPFLEICDVLISYFNDLMESSSYLALIFEIDSQIFDVIYIKAVIAL